MVWDGLVAVDLFLAGFGAWTFIFAILGKTQSDHASKAKLVGVIVAFVAVALGAVILAVDARGGLMNPLRYFNLFANFGSVMTWGVLLISLFLVGALVCGVLLIIKKQPPRILEILVAVPAVGVSVYTGILLSTAPAFPLWNIIALPAAFVVSAAYCGYAAFSLIERLMGIKESALPAVAQKSAFVLPVLEAIILVALVAIVSATQGSAAAAASASITGMLLGGHAFLFWGGVVVLGLAVPLVLAILRNRQGEGAPSWMGYVEWICILIGGFVFRYVIVVAAISMFV